MSVFPTAITVTVAATLLYVILDYLATAPEGHWFIYLLELAVPLLGLLLARGLLSEHLEGLALAIDLAFTAAITGRLLLLPTNALSGTALILAVKLLTTAVLFPWHPQLQYVSAASTMGLYCLAIFLGGHSFEATHQLAGPLVAGVLSCVGAAAADRTRKALWQQSVDLVASDRRTHALLETERLLAAVAREISVLSDLPTVLDRVNSLTAAALDCDVSNTYLVDEARREAAAAATNASDPTMRAQIMAVRGSFEQPVLKELLEGRTVVINDPAAQDWFKPLELAEMGIHSLALTPIAAKGTVLGVLTVTRLTSTRPFEEREIFVLKAIAAQAATAIENSRLFEGLARSEARYRDLFERATDLIFVVEADGPLRFANRAALEFIRASSERLPDLRWHDLVTDRARRQIERRLALARSRPMGSARPFEVDVHVPGAPHAVLEVRAAPVISADHPRAYHCIARDVTERRQHERETEQLLFKLREAHRLQAEFVANMSHELRTPLNVIIGYVDLLADEPGLPVGSDARSFLQRIANAGRALHRLVESVLEYARLDRGRTAILTTHFPADKLLGALRELCDDVRDNLDISLAIQDTSDIAFVTDYGRLYSTLSNLLLNALKFTPAGTIQLRVERVGPDAIFTVRDTGIGIAADALPDVFEPFRQVDGSQTRIYGGVGLGLAIVRRNTELLQGRIAVTSEVGAGTTFVLRIPIVLDTEADGIRTSTAA